MIETKNDDTLLRDERKNHKQLSDEELHSEEKNWDEDEPVTGSLLESKTSQLDDALLMKLEQAFHKPTSQYQVTELVKIAVEHDPIDLAHAITKLPSSARVVVYRSLPDLDAKTSFVINITSSTRVTIFRAISDEDIVQLLERMPADEAVVVLEDVPVRRMKRLLELLEQQKSKKIVELKQHRRHTAGRMMTNEFFQFSLTSTVGEVACAIRDNPGIEMTRWVFVVDDDEELVGFVPDRNLIVNRSDMPLRNLMRPVPHMVHPDTSRDEVVELFERYQLPVLPVVSSSDKLLGVITQEDVVEVMEDIADETIANIGGTVEDTSEDEPLFKRFISRAPWLLVTLLAGLITATGLSLLQGQPWFIVVPFFVPLITGMSGNVGIQCSTILVRGMATGEISSGTRRLVIIRELKIGSIIGVTFGILCGLAVYGLNTIGLEQGQQDPVFVGTIVSSGILGACFTATILGTLSPLVFAKLGIDPAIASGPIVTACNDVLSTYMYFFVAWVVSSMFALSFAT